MEQKELVKFMASVFYLLNFQADASSFLMSIMPAKVERMACIFLKAARHYGYLKCSMISRRKSEYNKCAYFIHLSF